MTPTLGAASWSTARDLEQDRDPGGPVVRPGNRGLPVLGIGVLVGGRAGIPVGGQEHLGRAVEAEHADDVAHVQRGAANVQYEVLGVHRVDQGGHLAATGIRRTALWPGRFGTRGRRVDLREEMRPGPVAVEP